MNLIPLEYEGWSLYDKDIAHERVTLIYANPTEDVWVVVEEYYSPDGSNDYITLVFTENAELPMTAELEIFLLLSKLRISMNWQCNSITTVCDGNVKEAYDYAEL